MRRPLEAGRSRIGRAARGGSRRLALRCVRDALAASENSSRRTFLRKKSAMMMAIARKPSRIAYSVVVWPSSRSRSSCTATCSATNGRIRMSVIWSSSYLEGSAAALAWPAPDIEGSHRVGARSAAGNDPNGWSELDLVRVRRTIDCTRSPAERPSSGHGGRPPTLAARGPRTVAASRRGLVTAALVFFAASRRSALVGVQRARGASRLGRALRVSAGGRGCARRRSPYPALDDPILEDQKGYVYPPQLLLALVPLTPLPVDVAAVARRARHAGPAAA